MKKMALLIAGILSGSVLNAAEFKDNPDRFPSIGVFYQGGSESGDVTFKASGLQASQDIKSSGDSITFDLRLPVSDTITLFGGISSTRSEFSGTETSVLNGQEGQSDGMSFGVGVRFYIH